MAGASVRKAYEEAVKRLYQTNLITPAKYGLKNEATLLERLGSPHETAKLRFVHVAGTNGKGSVCWKVAAALQHAGLRTGLFVSPHVSCFRERIRVDAVPVAEADVAALLPSIFAAAEAQERDVAPTFFEFTTAAALYHFARVRADAVVLETGLGGRLDSTNVVTPVVSVITSIGLDHMRVLGDSLEAIAAEKAGIIKPGVPVVLGPTAAARESILRAAEEAGSEVTVVEADEDGDFDRENAAVAEAALRVFARRTRLEVSDASVRHGCMRRPPCRFEVRYVIPPSDAVPPLSLVLDVAHNGDAMRSLFHRLRCNFPRARLHVLLGLSRDKDVKEVANIILQRVASPRDVHLVQSSHPRAADIDTLAAAFGGAVPPENCHSRSSTVWGEAVVAGTRDVVAAAMRSRSGTDDVGVGGAAGEPIVTEPCLADSGNDSDVVVICGSVYLMSEARAAIGIDEPRDDPKWNEL